jgi:CRP-like cAMP-binding protein
VIRDTGFMLGMILAGVADLIDARLLLLGCGLMLIAWSLLSLVLPGLRQPAAAFARLSLAEQQQLAEHAQIYELAPNTTIVQQGEQSDAIYFLLQGSTLAIREDAGTQRVLEGHGPGDFFGEIAALTALPRTASVLTDQQTTLRQIPAAALRGLMQDAMLSRLILSKLTERMLRMGMLDLPRFAHSIGNHARSANQRWIQPDTQLR